MFRTNCHVLEVSSGFQKKSQKVCDFLKNHDNSSIWLKLATIWTNYHVLGLSWGFQQKVARRCVILRKKKWKLIDLAKTRNILHKLACFRVFINFLAKSCRKFWFCEKSWQHIDLVKTISVSNKLPCFKVFIRFSANKYKKVYDFAKTAKINRIGQN